ALGWPGDWPGLVAHLAGLSRDGFLAALDAYTRKRVSGDIEHRRPCDRLAGAASPMKRIHPPTARMFYEGATRLHRSGVNVRPNRPTADARVALETYPALIARRFLGRVSYKAEGPHGADPARRDARRRVLDGLAGRRPMLDGRRWAEVYGFALHLAPGIADAALHDGTGDTLDALSCACEAAWGHTHRRDHYGIPAWCDPLEGWIVSPGMPHEPW
ncbi:MAG: DUF429 domain-containing protein, partial [Candidatus Lambdaproteobacteria bacterium]|nr:DUF429 domain-containing protein [Candidatus Lambdaproteobacteria bacterium]